MQFSTGPNTVWDVIEIGNLFMRLEAIRKQSNVAAFCYSACSIGLHIAPMSIVRSLRLEKTYEEKDLQLMSENGK